MNFALTSVINFDYKVYGYINFFDLFKIHVNDTIINTWIVSAILILFAVIVRVKLNSFKETPTGFQNFIETIVDVMENFCVSVMSEKYSYFGGWFFSVFLFILFSNLMGLFNLRPPTADISTTAALGLSTFFIIHVFGIMKAKGGYFKGYFEPIWFFFPLNIMGELALPISLSFRLFGNLLGGTIIMGLIYGLFPVFLKLGVPAVLHIYFDIFAGILQTYIFVILSMTFIRDKLPD
jgi:F-type H+-transporting ATPase subunit a